MHDAGVYRVRGLVGKVVAAFRDEGPWAFVQRIARRTWYGKDYTTFRKTLEETDPSVDHDHVVFRVARPEDIPWIAASMRHLGAEAQVLLEQQFRNGADLTTVGACKDSAQVVFCAWVSMDHLGLSLLAPEGQGRNASLRRVWVPEAYRRKGIASLGMVFTEQQAGASGVQSMWSFVLGNNTASQRLHRKLGYEEDGTIQIITRFGRRYARGRTRGVRRWMRMRISNEISGL